MIFCFLFFVKSTSNRILQFGSLHYICLISDPQHTTWNVPAQQWGMGLHDSAWHDMLSSTIYIQEPSGNHGFPSKSGPFLSLFLHICNVKNFNIYGLNFLIRIYKNENLWTWSHLKYHDTVTYQRKINRGRSYLQHH